MSQENEKIAKELYAMAQRFEGSYLGGLLIKAGDFILQRDAFWEKKLIKLQEKFDTIKYLQDIAKPVYEKMMNERDRLQEEIKLWKDQCKRTAEGGSNNINLINKLHSHLAIAEKMAEASSKIISKENRVTGDWVKLIEIIKLWNGRNK